MKEKYISELLKLSKKAYKKKDVPISALIVKENKIIAKAYNKKNTLNNAFYHAEILCLEKAYKKLKRWNLNDCEMYVSLEPCDMCKELIKESRIKKVFYILEKGKITNKYNKTIIEQMFDINFDEFQNMLNNFFKTLR